MEHFTFTFPGLKYITADMTHRQIKDKGETFCCSHLSFSHQPDGTFTFPGSKYITADILKDNAGGKLNF